MIRVSLRWIVFNCLRRSAAGERCSLHRPPPFCPSTTPGRILRRALYDAEGSPGQKRASSARAGPPPACAISLTQSARDPLSVPQLRCAVTITLPIACELLWLRSRARDDPDGPATEVVTSQQLKVLRLLGSRSLPDKPTIRDALWAVAGLGGHLKRNGEPGWLVLHRGLQTLLSYEAGYEAGLHARAKR